MVLDQLDPMLSDHYSVDYKLLITKASFSRKQVSFRKTGTMCTSPPTWTRVFWNFKCLLKDVKVETVINMPFKTGKQDCSEHKTLNNKNSFKNK